MLLFVNTVFCYFLYRYCFFSVLSQNVISIIIYVLLTEFYNFILRLISSFYSKNKHFVSTVRVFFLYSSVFTSNQNTV